MIDVCCVPTLYDEYIGMVKSGNECMSASQTTCCLSVTLLRQSVARKCCCNQVSVCHSTLCLVCCMRNGARSVPRNLTWHRLEHILTRLVDTHLWIASVKQNSVAYHPCIESVTSMCCLGPCCTHNSRGTLGSHFAHGSGAVGCSTLIHGSRS